MPTRSLHNLLHHRHGLERELPGTRRPVVTEVLRLGQRMRNSGRPAAASAAKTSSSTSNKDLLATSWSTRNPDRTPTSECSSSVARITYLVPLVEDRRQGFPPDDHPERRQRSITSVTRATMEHPRRSHPVNLAAVRKRRPASRSLSKRLRIHGRQGRTAIP